MKLTLDKNLKYAVAVSGGADSMVLLSLFLENPEVDFFAVNVEHGIRGESSKKDSEFVKDFCVKNGVKLVSFCVDAVKEAEEKKISVELAARNLRYCAFDSLIKEKKADVIALAHHADDQTETIVMRFLRGSGVRGLRGICDRDGYVHPLIDYTKEEILAYAQSKNLPFVKDESNDDESYTRNFLRHTLIPLIKTRFNGVSNTLNRNAKAFAELEDYLLEETTPYEIIGNEVCLPICVLDRHPAIAKKSIANALRVLADRDIEYAHLEAVYNLKFASTNFETILPFGLKAVKEYDRLTFMKVAEVNDYEMPFNIQATYYFCNSSYEFRQYSQIEVGVTFDADKVPADAVIRNRREGDRFRSCGGRDKSLSDYLTDKKIRKSVRSELLLLASGKRVLAVLGMEIADEIKITEQTKNIYKILVEELD